MSSYLAGENLLFLNLHLYMFALAIVAGAAIGYSIDVFTNSTHSFGQSSHTKSDHCWESPLRTSCALLSDNQQMKVDNVNDYTDLSDDLIDWLQVSVLDRHGRLIHEVLQHERSKRCMREQARRRQASREHRSCLADRIATTSTLK